MFFFRVFKGVFLFFLGGKGGGVVGLTHHGILFCGVLFVQWMRSITFVNPNLLQQVYNLRLFHWGDRHF